MTDAWLSQRIEHLKIRGLVEIKNILAKFDIPCMLGYGSCLGAVRDQKLILTDGDLDIIVLHENVKGQKEKVEKEFEKAGWKIKQKPRGEDKRIGDYCIFMCTHRNTFLPEESIGDYNVEILFYPRWKNWRWEFHNDKYMLFPRELFDNPKEIIFYGHRFFVPNPPEEYLRLCYGNDWRIPWPEQGLSSTNFYDMRMEDELPPKGRFDHKLEKYNEPDSR